MMKHLEDSQRLTKLLSKTVTNDKSELDEAPSSALTSLLLIARIKRLEDRPSDQTSDAIRDQEKPQIPPTR